LTYLSLLGGLGYVGYGIYINRNPVEQAEADPTKKTLVVLGKKTSRIDASVQC
jgi:NADH:ubiquinone reductase (non-electrogenic)